MIIRFREAFALSAAEVYPYFRSPADWVRLYGFAGAAYDGGNGWYAVPLKGLPFPLVARITVAEPPRRASWCFKGYSRGDSEIRLEEFPGGVVVEGHERLAVRWLWFFSPLVQRFFLERAFRRVWRIGWERLRKHEPTGQPRDGRSHNGSPS
jgi:hypothetical protein